ncbi:MAG: hypothetical protein K2W82_17490 [Candidatus Obscuribacterales bacterium]|nr:hypothetical protein [Candidatus Obscuribacterales bacterium]
MKFIKSNPHCPECIRNRYIQEDASVFLCYDNIVHCASCGLVLTGKQKPVIQLYGEFEVPPFLERLLKSLVNCQMLGITDVSEALIAKNEGASSGGVSLDFSHRALMIGGSMTWYQVKKTEKFKPHETDFESIARYAPIPSRLIHEFVNVDDFLVSECPGKEGRGLRNAGIRMLKYHRGSEKEGGLNYYVRAFLTWDINYRRLPNGEVEEIARK